MAKGMIDMSVFGDKEMAAAFRKIPAVIQHRVFKPATKEAWRPVLKDARSMAPRSDHQSPASATYGPLFKQLKLKFIKGTAKHGLVGSIVSTGTAFYARFIEYGYEGKGGQWVGPQPFMRPAFDRNKGRALRILLAVAKRLIEREITGIASKKVTKLTRSIAEDIE